MQQLPDDSADLTDAQGFSLGRYAAHMEQADQVVWLDGFPWRAENRRLEPMAMPHTMGRVNRSHLRAAMKKTDCWIARWVDQWDTQPCDWWWVCCDDPHYDASRFPSNGRRDVRAGMRRCTVSRLDPEFFAQNGHAIYAAAVRGYAGADDGAYLTTEAFARNVRTGFEYPGREVWGAFVESKLVGFASCIRLEDAVMLSWVKSDPAFHKALPNNALIYTLTRHYLVEEKLRYVSDGSRSVLHETSFQDFLQRMGYRRIYCPLRVELSPLLLFLLRSRPVLAPMLRRVRPAVASSLEAVARLWDVARSCRKVVPETAGP